MPTLAEVYSNLNSRAAAARGAGRQAPMANPPAVSVDPLEALLASSPGPGLVRQLADYLANEDSGRRRYYTEVPGPAWNLDQTIWLADRLVQARQDLARYSRPYTGQGSWFARQVDRIIDETCRGPVSTWTTERLANFLDREYNRRRRYDMPVLRPSRVGDPMRKPLTGPLVGEEWGPEGGDLSPMGFEPAGDVADAAWDLLYTHSHDYVGVEIELAGIDTCPTRDVARKHGWKACSDGSIPYRNGFCGAEIKCAKPMMVREVVSTLPALLEDLVARGAHGAVDNRNRTHGNQTGLHVHCNLRALSKCEGMLAVALVAMSAEELLAKGGLMRKAFPTLLADWRLDVACGYSRIQPRWEVRACLEGDDRSVLSAIHSEWYEADRYLTVNPCSFSEHGTVEFRCAGLGDGLPVEEILGWVGMCDAWTQIARDLVDGSFGWTDEPSWEEVDEKVDLLISKVNLALVEVLSPPPVAVYEPLTYCVGQVWEGSVNL